MKKSIVTAALLSTVLFACASEGELAEEVDAQEADLGAKFRSELFDLGELPFEATAISYEEDARPFERWLGSVSQTPDESKYVSYDVDLVKGDGLLLSAFKRSATETSGTCDENVRIWLLDSDNRVMRTGTRSCQAEYEEPGLQTESNVLRYYAPKSDTYKVVVTVLPSSKAAQSAPIRNEDWKWVNLHAMRSRVEHQGAKGSRCEDGTDILCKSSLSCERARCK